MKTNPKKKRKASAMKSLLEPMGNYLLKNAGEFPIYECLYDPNYKIKGQSLIIISRHVAEKYLLIGSYLVDLFCLGVKDTFHVLHMRYSEYQDLLERIKMEIELCHCPVDLAHAIIYGSIEYAEKLGFSPHDDFNKSRLILEPKNSFRKLPKVTFGMKGKPLYVSGPDDDVRFILDTLDRNVGKDNYDFIVNESGFMPEFDTD